MPYINPKERPVLEQFLDPLSSEIHTAGQLDYAIMRLLIRYTENGNFALFATAVGVLMLVVFEFVRRVVDGYEIKKCAENGDVF